MIKATHLPWWSRPELAFALVAVPVALSCYLIPASTYVEEWRTAKYFSEKYLYFTMTEVLAFCVACLGTVFIAGQARPAELRSGALDELPWQRLLLVFDITTALTLAGYLVWGGAAVARGADMRLVMEILGGSKGAASRMKEVYLVTIPGVTTLTQFGIPAVIMAVVLLTRYPVWRVAPGVGLVFGFALARAVLNSERLAVIELALPAIIIGAPVVSGRAEKRWWCSARTIALAPVLGFVSVLSLFSVSEYFRSWANFYANGNRSFVEFIAGRFTGYYATALNNGAFLAERLMPLDYPFFSIYFLYRFPLVNSLVRAVFESPLERENALLDILSRGANPEFNNGGGLLLPLIDWGFPGGLVFWVLSGVAAGASYASFRRMKLAGILTYPILFNAIVEAPRILYASEGRVFPAWCVVAATLVACRAAKSAPDEIASAANAPGGSA